MVNIEDDWLIAVAEERPPVKREKQLSLISAKKAFAASIVTLVVVCGFVTPVHAEGNDAETIASTVTAVTGAENVVLPVESTDSIDLQSSEILVSLPIDVDAPIQASNDGALPVSIGLPSETMTEEVEFASDGTAVYEGIANSADVTVQVLDNGLRFTTVIADDSQSDTFTYPIGGDTTPVVNLDGSVSLLKPFSATDPETGQEVTGAVVVAEVAVPWAIDAEGDHVATHFEVSDGVITQVVEHGQAGVVFPVVADPQITLLNAFQARVRWNRAETATIATLGWGATGLTAICISVGVSIGGPAAGAAFGAQCLLVSGSGVYTAGLAQNSRPKRCLQMTITNTVVSGPIPWFSTYGAGGYCR
jgi:hypothetical protein